LTPPAEKAKMTATFEFSADTILESTLMLVPPAAFAGELAARVVPESF
jgi:hypothetical protein